MVDNRYRRKGDFRDPTTQVLKPDKIYSPPSEGGDAKTYTRLHDRPLEAFKEFQVIDFSNKGGLLPLGRSPFPAQASLQQTIEDIQWINLVTSLYRIPGQSRQELMHSVGYKWQPYAKSVRLGVAHFKKYFEHQSPREVATRLQAKTVKHKITSDPVRIICGKARRTGITMWLLAHDMHTGMFMPNTEVAILAHELKSSWNIFRSIRRFYTQWPLEYEFAKPSAVTDANGTLVFNNGSKLACYTAGGQDIRSYQFDIVHLSEYAHYKNIEAVSSMLSAIPPHCWVFKESTANGKQGPFFEDWTRSATVDEVIQAYDDRNAEFFEHWNGLYKWFFSWLDDPRYEEPVAEWEQAHLEKTLSPYENSIKARFPSKFTWGRIKWRRNKISSGECAHPSLTPEQFFCQEYPCDEDELFVQSGDTPFASADLDIMEQRAKLSKIHQSVRMRPLNLPEYSLPHIANLLVWEPPVANAKYLLGCDIGRGIGARGDASTIDIFRRLDISRIDQVAAFHSKVIGARELGYIVAQLALFYNNAFSIIEASGPGELTISVVHDECNYKNLYRREILDKVSAEASMSFFLGYLTTGATKETLIQELIHAVRNKNIIIRDPKAINELRIYQRNEKGQYGAPRYYHDDRVMSIAFANFGNNILRGAPPLTQAQGRYLKRHNRHLADQEKRHESRAQNEIYFSEHSKKVLESVAKMHHRIDKEHKRPRRPWYLT